MTFDFLRDYATPVVRDAAVRALPSVAVLAVVVLGSARAPFVLEDLSWTVTRASPWWGVAVVALLQAVTLVYLYGQLQQARDAADSTSEAIAELAELPGQIETLVEHGQNLVEEAGIDDVLKDVRELVAHRRLHERMPWPLIETDGENIVAVNSATIQLLGEDPRGMSVSDFLAAFAGQAEAARAQEHRRWRVAQAVDVTQYRLPLGPRQPDPDPSAASDDEVTDGRGPRGRRSVVWCSYRDPGTGRTYAIGSPHA